VDVERIKTNVIAQTGGGDNIVLHRRTDFTIITIFYWNVLFSISLYLFTMDSC